MTRPNVTRQAEWARGQAAQHRRMASRYAAGSVARKRALDRAAMADAAAATLARLAADRAAGAIRTPNRSPLIFMEPAR